jgi:serine/threonine-protein kinase
MTQARLVGGRYELGELIGYGGMAEVHRGRDLRLSRDVAIKVLRADLARDPSFLNRFRREARSAAGLNHPSIVSVYDTGEEPGPDGTSQPYIVMEYVEGRTLRDILKAEGRLPARRAMEIAADICGALDFSHRNGVIHRDIKPANVMITHSGAVKVMDFGIARAVADNAATVTQTANVIGTAQYLSPEQARGETVDPRSDVYSTGCLLYELVTGVPPFQGDSPVAVAVQHVRENAIMPSARNQQVPRVLDSIVMKALAKNPLNRYQSAGDMRGDLQRALANQPVTAEAVMTDAERTQFIARTPPPPVAVARHDMDEPAPQGQRRGGLIWLSVVLAMLLVIGGVIALVYIMRNQDKNAPQAKAVPQILGMTAQQASSTLRQQGFDNIVVGAPVTDVSKCDKPVTQDTVCTVSPQVGESVKTNTKITYSIFSIKMVTVPVVTDMQYSEAAQKLNQDDLVPQAKQVNDPHPQGYVIAQDPPPYGKQVPAGTAVTLSVSTGKVVLPDVTKQNVDKAKAALNQLQFTDVRADQTTVTTDPKLNNIVVGESPTPGTAYPPDTTIHLNVYQYQPPPPTCDSGQTATVTPGAPPPATGSSSSTPGDTSTPLPPCTTVTKQP